MKFFVGAFIWIGSLCLCLFLSELLLLQLGLINNTSILNFILYISFGMVSWCYAGNYILLKKKQTLSEDSQSINGNTNLQAKNNNLQNQITILTQYKTRNEHFKKDVFSILKCTGNWSAIIEIKRLKGKDGGF